MSSPPLNKVRFWVNVLALLWCSLTQVVGICKSLMSAGPQSWILQVHLLSLQCSWTWPRLSCGHCSEVIIPSVMLPFTCLVVSAIASTPSPSQSFPVRILTGESLMVLDSWRSLSGRELVGRQGHFESQGPPGLLAALALWPLLPQDCLLLPPLTYCRGQGYLRRPLGRAAMGWG